MNAWRMKDNFVEGVALASIIGADYGVFHNIDTVAGAGRIA
jgi:hypothetical protein